MMCDLCYGEVQNLPFSICAKIDVRYISLHFQLIPCVLSRTVKNDENSQEKSVVVVGLLLMNDK